MGEGPQTSGDEDPLRRRALRASIAKDIVQSVAITVAGIWAVSTFYYREAYLPQRTDANVVVKASLDRLGESNGMVTLRFRATLNNPGRAVARILGYTVTSYGHRVMASPPDAGLPEPVLNAPLQQGSWVSVAPQMLTQREILSSYGTVFEPFNGRDNTTVRPEGLMEFEDLIVIPKSDFAAAETEVVVAWVPFALALDRECYQLRRASDGRVGVSSPVRGGKSCRLSQAIGTGSVSLW